MYSDKDGCRSMFGLLVYRRLAWIAVFLLSSCSSVASPTVTPQPTATPQLQLSTTSPDGNLRAIIWVVDDSNSCGHGHAVSIQILDVVSGQQIMTLKGDCHPIIRLLQASFSPDKKSLAVTGIYGQTSTSNGSPYVESYGYIAFWSLATGDLIVEYGCALQVEGFSFANDSSRMEGTCDPGYSFVLDTNSGKAQVKVTINATEATSPLYPIGGSLMRDLTR
jgi:hypothetical protein